jgi:hypothetical protein
MTNPAQQAHVDTAWKYLVDGPFEPLLRITYGVYDAGPASLEAVFRIMVGGWKFSQFPFNGASGDSVLALANALCAAIGTDFPWTLDGLERAAAEGKLPTPLTDAAADTVLRAMILRAPSRLMLLPVMHALGRQECQNRLTTGAQHYRAMNMVG